MVPWGDSPWWMQFVPAYFNGTSLFGAGVESYVSDAQGYNISDVFIGYDYAILRLYEPLGPSLGYFGYNSYSDAWNNLPIWSNIGYPGDIDNAMEPAFQQGFTIGADVGDGNGGDELETENCDLNHGNSGGPMFAWWNNGTDPRVVGVVSSQLTNAQQPPFLTRRQRVRGRERICQSLRLGPVELARVILGPGRSGWGVSWAAAGCGPTAAGRPTRRGSPKACGVGSGRSLTRLLARRLRGVFAGAEGAALVMLGDRISIGRLGGQHRGGKGL